MLFKVFFCCTMSRTKQIILDTVYLYDRHMFIFIIDVSRIALLPDGHPDIAYQLAYIIHPIFKVSNPPPNNCFIVCLFRTDGWMKLYTSYVRSTIKSTNFSNSNSPGLQGMSHIATNGCKWSNISNIQQRFGINTSSKRE